MDLCIINRICLFLCNVLFIEYLFIFVDYDVCFEDSSVVGFGTVALGL